LGQSYVIFSLGGGELGINGALYSLAARPFVLSD
jgi:hypothetical protein